MEDVISTPLKRLGGKVKSVTTTSVEKISKVKENSSQIIENIKEYDYSSSAQKVGTRFLKARRKTVAFYKRPLSDITHLSIVMVMILTLLTGFLNSFGTSQTVVINPFYTANEAKQNAYVSMTERRVREADLVSTMASIYSDNLAKDAYATTEELYNKSNVSSGGSSYLAAVPIVTTASVSTVKNTATKYTVKDGDTLSGIAVQFGITTDTIRYANQLAEVDSLKPGQELIILPMTGVMHTIAAGDTITKIANRYGVSEAMIVSQNGLYTDEDFVVGAKIMIPDAEIPEAPKETPQPSSSTGSRSSSSAPRINYVQTSTGPNHFPYGWCTWWVANKRYVPWNGNAWQWYGNAQAYGRAVGKTPVPGAIMVTWESGYGHVAYVESVNGSTFTVSEMNYTGFARVSTRTITTSSVPLIGFIY